MDKEKQIEVAGELYNVEESYTLYDTLGVVSNLSTLSRQPQGWFASFAAMGAANEHHFFDIRNMSQTDRAYNNQDTRDQTSWGFLLQKISVAFWCPNIWSQTQDTVDNYIEPFESAIWSGELPMHCGLTLKVNQDEHLKANCLMMGSGGGPVGGGTGQGFSAIGAGGNATQSLSMGASSQGVAEIGNPWAFPVPLGIPRRAAISVVITPSEWARNKLQAMAGPYNYRFLDLDAADAKYPVMFGIRVALHGQRLVQPRGAYRA